MHLSENREILIHEENFAYCLPCEKLRHFLSNYTITFPNRSIISDNYTILPHGSVTLVLFYYNREIHSFFFGPTTKPIKVGNLANQCDTIFIVEFQPAGFSPFQKINQNELTDQIVPFSLIDASLDTAIRHIFETSVSADELLSQCEERLLHSILFPYPEELAHAIQAVIRTDGVITPLDISKNVFYCPRHLNRLFHFYIGTGVKSFARLVRINRSIQLLNETSHTLSSICEKLGYYDVSHFVKDFKMICNITPQTYRTNMSDFYSEIAKF